MRRIPVFLLAILTVLGFAVAPAAADTRATSQMIAFSRAWEAGVDRQFGSRHTSMQSGIVGDAAHGCTGYHISREDLCGRDYSEWDFPADRRGPSWAASAVDLTMTTPAMIAISKRLWAAAHNGDPRAKYIRAFNGTLNGRTAVRLEFHGLLSYRATPDHLWHIHLEIHRAYTQNAAALNEVLSLVLGSAAVVSPAISPASQAYLVSQLSDLKYGTRNRSAYTFRKLARGVWGQLSLPLASVHDSRSVNATRAIQKRVGLPVTGVVDRRMWTMMILQARTPLVLTPGARGAAVKQAQVMLGQPADGIYGAQFEAVTRKWNAKRGCPAAASYSPPDWAALYLGRIPAGWPAC